MTVLIASASLGEDSLTGSPEPFPGYLRAKAFSDILSFLPFFWVQLFILVHTSVLGSSYTNDGLSLRSKNLGYTPPTKIAATNQATILLTQPLDSAGLSSHSHLEAAGMSGPHHPGQTGRLGRDSVAPTVQQEVDTEETFAAVPKICRCQSVGGNVGSTDVLQSPMAPIPGLADVCLRCLNR